MISRQHGILTKSEELLKLIAVVYENGYNEERVMALCRFFTGRRGADNSHHPDDLYVLNELRTLLNSYPNIVYKFINENYDKLFNRRTFDRYYNTFIIQAAWTFSHYATGQQPGAAVDYEYIIKRMGISLALILPSEPQILLDEFIFWSDQILKKTISDSFVIFFATEIIASRSDLVNIINTKDTDNYRFVRQELDKKKSISINPQHSPPSQTQETPTSEPRPIRRRMI